MATTPSTTALAREARRVPVPESELTAGADATSIGEAREAAKGCHRCQLWRNATQTVFGEGPETADVVFVGEQPGNQEDLAGKPFEIGRAHV